MAKLYFRYAAMNAGKSTQLLQIAHNYEALGKAVLLVTAGIDGRFGPGVIASRLGASRPAECFDETSDMFTVIAKFRDEAGQNMGAVLIDEAQFLSAQQVCDIHRVVHQLNVPVLCFGLRTDFVGQPFPGAAMLLALAESIEEIKNVCACGRKATMNVRFLNGMRVRQGPQVMIGDAEYRQCCGECFYEETTDHA